jgi:hypothetical protein
VVKTWQPWGAPEGFAISVFFCAKKKAVDESVGLQIRSQFPADCQRRAITHRLQQLPHDNVVVSFGHNMLNEGYDESLGHLRMWILHKRKIHVA